MVTHEGERSIGMRIGDGGLKSREGLRLEPFSLFQMSEKRAARLSRIGIGCRGPNRDGAVRIAGDEPDIDPIHRRAAHYAQGPQRAIGGKHRGGSCGHELNLF